MKAAVLHFSHFHSPWKLIVNAELLVSLSPFRLKHTILKYLRLTIYINKWCMREIYIVIKTFSSSNASADIWKWFIILWSTKLIQKCVEIEDSNEKWHFSVDYCSCVPAKVLSMWMMLLWHPTHNSWIILLKNGCEALHKFQNVFTLLCELS